LFAAIWLTRSLSPTKLAEEFQIQPSQIHNWVNQVLAQAEKAFDRL